LYATGEHLALVDKVDSDYLKYISRIPTSLQFEDYATGAYLNHQTNFIYGMLPWLESAPAWVPDDYKWGKPTTFKYFTQFCDAQCKEDCDRLFEDARDLPEGCGKFYYFSDDSFLVIKFGGILYLFEIDISQCDVSNQFPIFTLCLYYLRIVKMGDNMRKLLQQASRPVVIRNPSNLSEYVKMFAQSFWEFSGIRNTGTLNGTSCECIGLSIGAAFLEIIKKFAIDEILIMPDLVAMIVEAAASIGFVVTVSQAYSYNQVTFLKRAYNGSTSWLVYGCVLRSLGITQGVLQPEMLNLSKIEFKNLSEYDKFEILLVQGVQGLCNEPSSCIMDALRYRASLTKSGQGLEFCKCPMRVSNLDILDRYGGEEHELLYLCSLIESLQPFDVVTCDFLERIFSRDYGSEKTFTEEPPPSVSLSFDQTF